MRWRTNENCVPRVTFWDQDDGGPKRTLYPGLHLGPMRLEANDNCVHRVTFGTNEMEDQ